MGSGLQLNGGRVRASAVEEIHAQIFSVKAVFRKFQPTYLPSLILRRFDCPNADRVYLGVNSKAYYYDSQGAQS